MKQLYLIIALCLLGSFSKAQSDTIVRYYNSSNTSKNVSKAKAEYSETRFSNADSSVTTIITNLKEGKIESSKTYKGEEPVGIWKVWRNDKLIDLDYSFTLNYDRSICKSGHPSYNGTPIPDLFSDIDSLHYKAPQMADWDKSLMHFLMWHIIYPPNARDNGITGKVLVSLTINEDGTVQEIKVVAGNQPELVKEAVRVVRLMRFKTPALLDSKPIKICFVLPVAFNLQ